MSMKMMEKSSFIKIFNSSLNKLPSPSNISYNWNYGSLLALSLMIQIITGLFLSMHYMNSTQLAFESVIYIMRDVNNGWLIRFIHMNTASMFFVFIYMHIMRGLYYSSYKNKETWISGVSLLLLLMMVSFIGYVLPWGQMSFWGATVITNLLSAIPYIGVSIVEWLWGGFSIDYPTLSRFFIFHFIIPFIMAMVIMAHMVFLHEKSSSNPLSLSKTMDKIPFNPYFYWKDLMGFFIFMIILSIIYFKLPYVFSDPDNFIKSNSLVTPEHIMPEWYFLFAYAILRSIPNKLGGVLALVSSVSILYLVPFMFKSEFLNLSFMKIKKFMFWTFVFNLIILTWIGSEAVKEPFLNIGMMSSLFYFVYFMFMSM